MQKPKGTYDLLPEDIWYWRFIEDRIHYNCNLFNYKEIRTPIFEAYETFHRNNDDSSDMVQKETYDFLDRANRRLTLRPEGTAGVARSYVENKLYVNGFQKYYYIGPMFRYERSQKGRHRQFAQFGLEAFGSSSPYLDVDVILAGYSLLTTIPLNNIRLRINTIGSPEERKHYCNVLREYFSSYKSDLCEDCINRLLTNPLRVLDCKVDREKEFFKNAPRIIDYLGDESLLHFEKVESILESLNIPYEVDYNLVRGLDYYSDTVFEYDYVSDNFTSTLGGGGRYNGLVEELGGPNTPSCGVAFGLDRLVLAMKEDDVVVIKPTLDFYVICLSEDTIKYTFDIVKTLRDNGYSADFDFNLSSLKKQFKESDRFSAFFTLIVGEDEVKNDTIQFRENLTKEQVTIKKTELLKYALLKLRG